MEKTDSGLLVPEGAIPYKQETWPHTDVKLVERLAKSLDDAGRNVQLLFICVDCKKAGKLPICNPAFDQRTGEMILICHCTARRLSQSI